MYELVKKCVGTQKYNIYTIRNKCSAMLPLGRGLLYKRSANKFKKLKKLNKYFTLIINAHILAQEVPKD